MTRRYPDWLWQRRGPAAWLLWPFSLVFCLLASLRRAAYRLHLCRSHHVGVPVIVVGNLSVGGTGKTPLVLWLVNWLRRQGYRPGILTRGYAGRSTHWPITVQHDTDPRLAGDEAVLLATHAGCPVVAGPDRVSDAGTLVNAGCDILVSDDGLQHYRLRRAVEIAVVDGERGHGNRWCLPAGPLRETPARLRSVDIAVTRGGPARPQDDLPEDADCRFEVVADSLYRLVDNAPTDWREISREFSGRPVHAVAGIGHPGRFFDLLRQRGLAVIPHPFPDHHVYTADDLDFGGGPVLLTEKDAVKCRQFAQAWHYVLTVRAEPNAAFIAQLSRRMDSLKASPKGNHHG